MCVYQDAVPPRERTIRRSGSKFPYAFAHARNGIQYKSSKPVSESQGPSRIGRPLRPRTVTSSRVSLASRLSVPAKTFAGSRGLFDFGVSVDGAVGVAALRRLPAAMN